MYTTDRTAVPATGGTGTYGAYPYLCGTNTGYHCKLVIFRVSQKTSILRSELSKPQPNPNTMVGFDTKMTVQTPPPTTQAFQALLDELES